MINKKIRKTISLAMVFAMIMAGCGKVKQPEAVEQNEKQPSIL